MILRPYGIVVEGELELGLEMAVEDDGSFQLRPHTGVPEEFVLSPAFANAHSHLEYRGLQGRIGESAYWPWIRELTRLKAHQDIESVREEACLAARENKSSGVAFIEEHSDRPVAGEALAGAGLDGVIYQEVITFLEQECPEEKWQQVEERAAANRQFWKSVYPSPHSAFLVDESTLQRFVGEDPFSIHVAETAFERQFFGLGAGPIAELYEQFGVRLRTTGESVISYLDRLGLVRPNAQFVHACDVTDNDIEILARGGPRIAHCPRSNEFLGCPRAPVRRFLEAGLRVGLGLDSAASSGAIDFFAEMRAALQVSIELGEPLMGAQIWKMATTVPKRADDFIILGLAGAESVDDLIESGSPASVIRTSARPVLES